MSHGPHKSHNLEQEVIVAKAFWAIIVVYFFLELFLALSSKDLIGGKLFTAEGMSLFWQSIANTWLVWIKPVFITLNILLVIIGLYSAYKVWPYRQCAPVFKNPHGGHHGHEAAGAGHGAAAPTGPKHNPKILRHWTDIVKRANTGTPENLRWSIMESDALVDMAIKEKGLPGETMADRLANFRREEYKTVDKLWDAHRLRNEIAHTPGFKVSTKQAEKALLSYRDFLKEIKAF